MSGTEEGLFRISDAEFAALREKVRLNMSEKRFRHILGVEKTAAEMAAIHVPEMTDLLRVAALLHDYTKEYDTERQIAILSSHGEDEECYVGKNPQIYHALTAPYVIQEQFPQYADPVLLQAIRRHTTGDAGMTVPDMILYLADYIEDGRTYDDCVFLRQYYFDGIRRGEEPEGWLLRSVLTSLERIAVLLKNKGCPIDRANASAAEDIRRKLEVKTMTEQMNQTENTAWESRDIGMKIAEILYRKKAKGITMLYVEKQTSVTEYYVIATGNSRTQIGALRDETDEKMSEAGLAPLRIEGRGNGTWELLDFGSVVVHIFSKEARDFYQLEKLWADAEVVDLEPVFAMVDKEATTVSE